MSKDDIQELQSQLNQIAMKSSKELSDEMEIIASDVELADEEREALYGDIREKLEEMRKMRETLKKNLAIATAAIDEVETRLNEKLKSEKRAKKKIHILPPAPTNAQIDYQEKKERHFAQGMTFYKLFWVFFIGCFAGVVIETIWCIIRNGHYESRVGLIYGPFNLVYGLGALFLSGALYRFRNRGRVFSFVGGFLVGSVIEYACSWFQEIVFGSTSWDYSHMPFNINGRICLLYSVFWGILGILWIKDIYPRMAKWILKIPNRIGKTLTWVLLAFMIFNSAMTGLTVLRWIDRREDVPASNAFDSYLDQHYPDERMQKIFANLVFTEDREAQESQSQP